MKYKHLFWTRPFLHLMTAPFIYAVFIPFVLLDIVAEIYHRICFPVYRLPYIERSKYVHFDRQRLEYLDLFSKVNCLYCQYANGLLAYVSAIAAATEGYFCGIQHDRREGAHVPSHHKEFLPYGDEAAYRAYVKEGTQGQVRSSKGHEG